ncbi:XRE family transcriptional regulator [Gordonibacter sp. An230]|uniref:helix-turn-helix transcriptional regulator n=1 Tax=Gordonibacter sp. An230 TaxID=1965592 RepID=UPI000B57A30F|nr:helix-turn-helix transcriptional regulator [Gordonibacter sp. An230]OUO91321.1 XRE family transcriptional regulator [Gordonibacter sp. An230]
MSFAENLVCLRQLHGITQENLAEQLGVSRQTVSKWEAGANHPEMDKLIALCDLFHVGMDDLMRGNVRIVKESDTERYDRHMNLRSASIAIGVSCIIAGAGLQLLLAAVGLPGNLQVTAMLSCLVVAASILIVASLGHREFKRRNPDIEPHYADKTLDRFGRRYPVFVAAGVALALIGIIAMIGFAPYGSASPSENALESLSTPIFVFTLAVAAGLLVWATMQKSKYDLSELTHIAHGQDARTVSPATVADKSFGRVRAKRIMWAACGAIMLLATIVFLIWGFAPLLDQIGAGGSVSGKALEDTLRDVVREGRGGFAVSWISLVAGIVACGIVWMVGNAALKTEGCWADAAFKENARPKRTQDDVPQDRRPCGVEGRGATSCERTR